MIADEVDAVATIERSLLAVDADDAATAVDISSLASSTAALSLTVGQQTLLMLAAAAGLERCCEALLRAGADITAQDSFGFDALYYAVHGRRFAVIDLLLQAGAPVDAAQGEMGSSVLIEAAIIGEARIASLLCAARALPNALDASGSLNAVRAALRSSSWDVALVLGVWGAEWGRDEMACAEGGWHRAQGAAALEAGRTAVLLGVIGASAASLPALSDADGQTALHCAARRGWPDGCRHLLHARADPNARDREGHDACYVAACAARRGSAHHRVVHTLLINGSNAKWQSPSDGVTAFMAACAAGSVKVAVALWEHRADVHAVDSSGRTAFHHLALRKGSEAAEEGQARVVG